MEWLISEAPVPYPEAVAFMEARAADRPRDERQIKALAVINHWLTITW